MIEDLIRLKKEFIKLKIVDICSKVSINLTGSSLEKSNYQLIKNINARENKHSLEKSNYQLVKRKEGRK